MDRYFSKSPKQKSDDQFTKLGRVVAVVGKSGIGKTWTVRHELNPCIELTADVLRSKHETLDFLEKIRSSNYQWYSMSTRLFRTWSGSVN